MKWLAAIALMLVGCSGAWSESVPGPSGPAFSVGCRRGVENCYREAARLCPTGYQVLDRWGGRPTGLVATGPNTAVVTHSHEKMLVECRPATASR
jgi:hypothetical protein